MTTKQADRSARHRGRFPLPRSDLDLLDFLDFLDCLDYLEILDFLEILELPEFPLQGRLSRKEVFQPHLPVRLPCYDLAPITSFALGRSSR